MLRLYVYGAVALLALALAAAGGAAVARWYYLGDIAEIERQARVRVDEANLRANQAAMRYEEWKASQRPKIVTVTREVERVLQDHREWRDARLPDGVRERADRAAAELGAAEPAAAVPAAAPGAERHQR